MEVDKIDPHIRSIIQDYQKNINKIAGREIVVKPILVPDADSEEPTIILDTYLHFSERKIDMIVGKLDSWWCSLDEEIQRKISFNFIKERTAPSEVYEQLSGIKDVLLVFVTDVEDLYLALLKQRLGVYEKREIKYYDFLTFDLILIPNKSFWKRLKTILRKKLIKTHEISLDYETKEKLIQALESLNLKEDEYENVLYFDIGIAVPNGRDTSRVLEIWKEEDYNYYMSFITWKPDFDWSWRGWLEFLFKKKKLYPSFVIIDSAKTRDAIVKFLKGKK